MLTPGMPYWRWLSFIHWINLHYGCFLDQLRSSLTKSNGSTQRKILSWKETLLQYKLKAHTKLSMLYQELYQLISTVFTWEMDQIQSSFQQQTEIIGLMAILWSMLSESKMDKCSTAIDILKLQSYWMRSRLVKHFLLELESFFQVQHLSKFWWTCFKKRLGIFTAVKNSRKELQIPHLLIIRKKLTLYLRLITHSTLKSINLRKSLTSKVLAMTTSMANLLTMFLLIQKLIETPERWWLSDTMSKEARTVNKEPSITQWSTKIEKLPQMWPSQSLVQGWSMTL